MSSFRRRAALGLSVLALAVTVGWPAVPPEPARATPAAPTDEGTPAGPPGVLPPDRQWTVTLLTGEVVGVATDAEGRATVKVRRARGPVDLVRDADGDVYVLPAGAQPLLAEVVHREVFNVVGLVRQGYHDEATATIPLIVQHLPAPAGDALGRAADAGEAAAASAPAAPDPAAPAAPTPDPAADEPPATGDEPTVAPAPADDPAGPVVELPSIDAVAVAPAKGGPETAELLAALAPAAGGDARRGPAPRVWLDRRIGVTRADPAATPAVPAAPTSPAAPAAPAQPAPTLDWNLTGIGADRAWADGLRGDGARVAVLDTGIDATHPDLAGQVVEQQNFSVSPDTVDRYGHGTHVAATVAGTGAGAPGTRSGVAPAADLYVGKVLDDAGFGSDSSIIAGMEWAAARSDVVNMSLGGGAIGEDDPLAMAVDRLTEQHGTLFVVSAGNSGPHAGTVESPGIAPRALTVGAVDRADEVAWFSSRGPLPGTYASKPDLVAPGVDVVAARASGTAMGSPVDALYTRSSGTSMAAPHVAGAAALLVGRHPDWSPDQLTRALVGAVDPVPAGGFDAGTGRLDVGSAAATELQGGEDIVDVALPHPRTGPHTRALTWTNTGTTPRTVDLSASLEDRDGEPVAAATVEPARLTVAPGATAEATLTIDAPALPDGLLTGAVVAESPGEQPVRTGLGVHAAAPLVELTLDATSPEPDQPEQSPASLYWTVTNLDDSALYAAWDAGYELHPTLQVPAGRYSVLGVVRSGDAENRVAALVGDPDVQVDGATVVTMDGTAAEPLAPDVAGVDTGPPTYSNATAFVTPEHGTGGESLSIMTEGYFPSEPVRLGTLEGAADVFQGRMLFRLQEQPYTARLGRDTEPVTVTPAHRWQPPAGTTRLTAAWAGDGSDLTGTAGKLVVVQLPAESWMDASRRAAITHRAAEAGAAMVAFVDAARGQLYPLASPFQPWADLPVIAAGGDGATRLQAAAAAGRRVTLVATAARTVHDLTLGGTTIDATPVIDQAARDELARIDERFHHDADGTGPTFDSRGLMGVDGGYLASAGPLAERRTSYVTPGVEWGSAAGGPYRGELFPGFETDLAGDLSFDDGVVYEPGSQQSLRWLRRPQWPGPVAATMDHLFCPAYPSLRTDTQVLVHLVPFRDGPDRFTCADALGEELVLRRGGQELGREAYNSARFMVPEGGGDEPFELSYTQQGRAPYEHRSTTTWSFRAPPPDDPTGGGTLLPLLTVRYRLPLDIENRPTGDTATLVVDHLDPEAPRRVETMLVWTSTDQGATWQPATVTRASARRFDVTLPDAPDGTAVSLRVDATHQDGSRIQQTLFDTYRA